MRVSSKTSPWLPIERKVYIFHILLTGSNPFKISCCASSEFQILLSLHAVRVNQQQIFVGALAAVQPGHSIIPNRSVWYFSSHKNWVPWKIGTDRFLQNISTEEISFGTFGSVSVFTKHYRADHRDM